MPCGWVILSPSKYHPEHVVSPRLKPQTSYRAVVSSRLSSGVRAVRQGKSSHDDTPSHKRSFWQAEVSLGRTTQPGDYSVAGFPYREMPPWCVLIRGMTDISRATLSFPRSNIRHFSICMRARSNFLPLSFHKLPTERLQRGTYTPTYERVTPESEAALPETLVRASLRCLRANLTPGRSLPKGRAPVRKQPSADAGERSAARRVLRGSRSPRTLRLPGLAGLWKWCLCH